MQTTRSMLYIALTLTIIRSLLLTPLVQAAQAQEAIKQPHIVRFQTVGLPAGVELTVSGERTNPGEQTGPYSNTFTSPGPSANLTTEPYTGVTYSGFPASVEVEGVTYALVSASPASPFTSGASAGTTLVTATYQSTGVKADQTITFDQPLSPAVYGTTFTVAPTASSGLAVTLLASGSCSNTGFDVTMTSGEGECTLTASQPGNTSYNPAMDVVRTVQAAKAEQAITFEQPLSPAVYGTSFTVAPNASSGLAVTLLASGSCTNTGFDVTMTSGTGDCTLTASQPGDANYNPATDVEQTVAAAKAEQTVTFDQPNSPAVYGTSFTVAPTASSELPVTLLASGSCSNTGFDVTMTSSTGDCTLTASQPGNSNYNPATDVVRTVQATKAEQTITFGQPASPAAYLATFSLTYSASSGLPVSMAASGACRLIDDVTAEMYLPFGACVLTASQPGDSNYNAAADVVRTVDPLLPVVIFAPVIFTP